KYNISLRSQDCSQCVKFLNIRITCCKFLNIQIIFANSSTSEPFVANSATSESQAYEGTNQAKKSTMEYGNFILASHYSSFNMSDEFSAIDLHESLRDALLELDQNVQKKGNTNLESIPNSLKQTNDQIDK
ncbi:17099_t:CDS:1, partial [Gigaspora rosea]